MKQALVFAFIVSIALNLWLSWKIADQYGALEAGAAREYLLVAQLKDLTAVARESRLDKNTVLTALKQVQLDAGEKRLIDLENPNEISAPPLLFYFDEKGLLRKIKTSISTGQ